MAALQSHLGSDDFKSSPWSKRPRGATPLVSVPIGLSSYIVPSPFSSAIPPCCLSHFFLPAFSQNLERSGNQHKAEVEAIMEQLKELKQKGDRDKETLKKAIRAQKERAEKSEEYAEQLHVQLADKVQARACSQKSAFAWRGMAGEMEVIGGLELSSTSILREG